MAKVASANKKLNNLIRQTVIKVIREVFDDPDYGLPLSRQTIQRLKKSMESKEDGRVIDFEKILKKYSK